MAVRGAQGWQRGERRSEAWRPWRQKRTYKSHDDTMLDGLVLRVLEEYSSNLEIHSVYRWVFVSKNC